MTYEYPFEIPRVGFGTAKLEQDTEDIVYKAIVSGYRHFDCAEYYGNEEAVGKALNRALTSGLVKRGELFITSKVWTSSIADSRVCESFHTSLKKLQLEYLDLYLLHWPVPAGYHIEAWRRLISLRDTGYVRLIGVSNYTIEDINELIELGLELPYCNQLEVNPLLFREKTIRYMQSLSIHVVAYRILNEGDADLNEESTIMRIAGKHEISHAQVIIGWCLNNRISVLVITRDGGRMIENLKTMEWILDETDMHAIGSMTTEERLSRFERIYRICSVRDTHITIPRDTFTLD